MKKQFILDLSVGVAACIELVTLILRTSEKHCPSLILLLPLLTAAYVVIYSCRFESLVSKQHKKEIEELFLTQRSY